MTPLDKPLKRSLKINKRDFVITLDPQILKITEKGRRIGLELKWADIVSGESALAFALQASVGKFQDGSETAVHKKEKSQRSIRKVQSSLNSRRVAAKRAPS
jgi:hypothetical protein